MTSRSPLPSFPGTGIFFTQREGTNSTLCRDEIVSAKEDTRRYRARPQKLSPRRSYPLDKTLKHRIHFLVITTILFLVGPGVQLVEAQNGSVPQRIISMSPSVTEILFAVGAGDRVVGVTDFCTYPAQALEVTRIGGLLNPNLERLIQLKPDLLIHHHDSTRIQQQARHLGIKTLAVKLDNLDHILESILIIGEAVGNQQGGQALHSWLKDGIEFYRSRLKDQRFKSVLMILADSEDPINDLLAIGKGTFLDELLTLAGGKNVISDGLAPYPKISREFIIMESPEVIIEAGPMVRLSSEGLERHKKSWQNHPTIRAVRDGNIHFIGDDYILIPGPRLLKIVSRFAKAIHPEIFTEPSLPEEFNASLH